MRVLFVCDDNRIVSPMAAAFLYHERRRRAIDSLVVASAGLAPRAGPIDPDVVKLLADRGVDLSRKHTRRLDAPTAGGADLIVTLTLSHARQASAKFPDLSERVFVFGHLGALVASRPPNLSADVWISELKYRTDRSSLPDDGSLDIQARDAVGFAAVLDLADQLLVATDHLVRSLWPNQSLASTQS